MGPDSPTPDRQLVDTENIEKRGSRSLDSRLLTCRAVILEPAWNLGSAVPGSCWTPTGEVLPLFAVFGHWLCIGLVGWMQSIEQFLS